MLSYCSRIRHHQFVSKAIASTPPCDVWLPVIHADKRQRRLGRQRVRVMRM